MKCRAMISIIGVGRVGTSIAIQLVKRAIDDILLIDVVQKRAEGEAMDLSQMAAEGGHDVEIRGSNDFSKLKDSDLIIVPAGVARTAEMTRTDLLVKNMEIIRSISLKIKESAPTSKVMMITNPVDTMTFLALKTTGFPRERIFGMAGLLDSLRFKSILAPKLGMSYKSVQALVIGEHGEHMLPLIRFSSANGIPLLELLSKEDLEMAKNETIKIAAQVIALKGSTAFAPSEAVATMAESIIMDKKMLIPTSTLLNGEYGVDDVCIGVPIILGKEGVEKIVELNLNQEEKAEFMSGVDSIRKNISNLNIP